LQKFDIEIEVNQKREVLPFAQNLFQEPIARGALVRMGWGAV